MALGANLIWDVRTTGNDTNGGGFLVGSSGTDYSQQNSPQFSYTDLVIAATTTNVTSAAQPFTSAAVGNIINITGGTGFTTGRYQVISVSGVIATLDRAVGTAASTGGTGNLGGCFLTVAAALAAATGGGASIIYIKAGTYTITTGLSTFDATISLIGYNATHGDNGTPPVITTATNSITVLSWGSPGMSFFGLKNITFTCTAATPGVCINQNTNAPPTNISNCTISGFTFGFVIAGGGAQPVSISGCNISGCTIGAIYNINSAVNVSYCYIHNNAAGWYQQSPSFCFSNIFYSNTGVGVYNFVSSPIDSCLFLSNGSDGIQTGSTLIVSNCIFYGNGGWGINTTNTASVAVAGSCYNNAYGANTSGNVRTYYVADGTDVTLTGNPCTAPASGNFTLNSTAGAGAACKAVGYPGTIIGTSSAGFTDIGTLQSASSGGSYGFTS
jgi:hypothetical protein